MRRIPFHLLVLLLICAGCTKKTPGTILPPEDNVAAYNEIDWSSNSIEPDATPTPVVVLPTPTPTPRASGTPTPTPTPTRTVPRAIPPAAQPAGVSLEMPELGQLLLSGQPATASGQEGVAQPCEAMGRRLATPADCREYARQKEAIVDGVAAFHPPTPMRVGDAVPVLLVIGDEKDKKAVVESLGGDSSSAKTFRIKVGDNVSMELTAPPGLFEISTTDKKIQPLPVNHRAKWEWSVKPLVAGHYKLTLTVGVPAVGIAGAQDFMFESTSYDIEVSPRPRTWSEFFDDTTKFLLSLKGMLIALAAVITAAGGIWLALRKLRGAKKKA